MKQLIPLFVLLIALEGAPAYSQEILTGIVDSKQIENVSVIMNDKGFTREIRTKTTEFEYLTKDGAHVFLPYKVKGLKDSRRFRVKHPFLYMFMPLVPTLIWEGLRATTPIP